MTVRALTRALLFGMAAMLVTSPAAAQTQDRVDLKLVDLKGAPETVGAPGQVTVVNFWATWCIPCQHEMPLFVDLQKKYKDSVKVITVSLDDKTTQSHIDAFMNKYKMDLPILLGTTADLKKAGLGEALPATMVLDANGNVIARVLGEISKSDLHKRVDYALTGKGSPPPALVNNLAKKKDDDAVHVF